MPQSATSIGVHVVPTQHPALHEVASHTHAPATQCWPIEHAPPAPQAHAPFAAQWSVRVASQLVHAAPSIPQLDIEGTWHVAPTQHPVPHELASQMQVPPEQRWPAPQGLVLPHAHTPDAEQRSARTGSHRLHAAPPSPQVAMLAGLHVEPEQQPLAQVAVHSAHVPLVHDPAQLWHAPPPLPHAEGDVPV